GRKSGIAYNGKTLLSAEFDEKGNIVKINSSEGHWTIGYDRLTNVLTKKTRSMEAKEVELKLTYNNRGLIDSDEVTFQDKNLKRNYDYDRRGFLESVIEKSVTENNLTEKKDTFTYNQDGIIGL